MSERGLRLLRIVVVAAFVLAILGAIFLPVYSDETGWRFQERAGIDGVDRMFNDICGPNTLAVPPFFMMPVRAFSASTNLLFADPFWVRVSGILYALVWTWMVLVLIGRIAFTRLVKYALGLIALGLMALANTPLILAMSRPEQPLLLVTTAALLIALADWKQGDPGNPLRTTPRSKAWLRSALLFTLGVIALSYHLKALFLLPLLLVCLVFCCRGRETVLPRLVSGALLIVVGYVSATYWIDRLACPDDPALQELFALNNFGAGISGIDSMQALVGFVGQLVSNISLAAYVQLVAPVYEPMSSWLPPQQVSEAAMARWEYFLFVCWGLAGIAALLGFAKGARNSWLQRWIDPRVALSAVLVAAIVAWSATQGERNIYEAGLALPLLMLAVVLAISSAAAGARAVVMRNTLATLLGFAGIASIVFTAMLWMPSLRYANRQEAYIPVMPFSIPVFGYAQVKPQILKVAKQCHIPEPARAHRVVIDELTYFAFMPSHLPEHRLGVFKVWNGSIKDPIAYLKARNSDGIVVGCKNLPPDLRARAKSQGQFCCLGPEEWNDHE